MDASPLIDAAIVFLPLLGAVAAGMAAYAPPSHTTLRIAQGTTCGALLLAMALAFWVFGDFVQGAAARTHILGAWLDVGGFKAAWALRVDTLAVAMFAVVTGVSAMVHLYSIGYMHGDRGQARFMAYLSLFTFFMLMLVSADNLLQMFFGWEGVGLCSYLLIGYWHHKPAARAAAMKAFWVNRVGDLGFLLGIFGCASVFGSVDFAELFALAPKVAPETLTLISLLLFIGAMGKSAQLGLHTWLPDAMEGPTPVSALIHAATMVTAGVFMLARLSPLLAYAPDALAVIALVGAATSVFAATIGLAQFDIKRVIAYSTMSQLGMMIFAIGVSAYGAAMFHLVTHAFFKALLFLAAGSVIHALSGEQDMRKMGGLWRKIPFTYALMWIGSLALAGIGIEGVFGFAGFYSKEMILEAAYAHGTWVGTTAYALGVLTAFMTAFYSWRLLALAFHGEAKSKAEGTHAHAPHESGWMMLGPLVPLALGSVVAGALLHPLFASAPDGAFWRGAIAAAAASHGHAPLLARLLPLALAIFGAGLAFWLYLKRPRAPALMAARLGGFYRLVRDAYRWDALYDRLFALPMPRVAAWLWRKGDVGVIDRFGPDGMSAMTKIFAAKTARLQTGFVFHYAFVMAAALAALAAWAMVRG